MLVKICVIVIIIGYHIGGLNAIFAKYFPTKHPLQRRVQEIYAVIFWINMGCIILILCFYLLIARIIFAIWLLAAICGLTLRLMDKLRSRRGY